jgi:hypothetical protein
VDESPEDHQSQDHEGKRPHPLQHRPRSLESEVHVRLRRFPWVCVRGVNRPGGFWQPIERRRHKGQRRRLARVPGSVVKKSPPVMAGPRFAFCHLWSGTDCATQRLVDVSGEGVVLRAQTLSMSIHISSANARRAIRIGRRYSFICSSRAPVENEKPRLCGRKRGCSKATNERSDRICADLIGRPPTNA